jgi:uncharacterized protein (TIGR03000 family)
LALGLGFGYGGFYPGYSNSGVYVGADNYLPPIYAGAGGVDTYLPPAGYDMFYPPPESAAPPAQAPAAGSARLTIQLPATATLWIDGQPTQQTGAVRQFTTPDTLVPGRLYTYTFRAQWVENGQPVTRERTVEFKAGNQVIVNFNEPPG